MTDRELLELAANAYGLENYRWDDRASDTPVLREWGPLPNNGWQWLYKTWNPLANDGEAFRLAAKLKINLLFEEWADASFVVAVPAGRLIDGQNEVLANEEDWDASVRRAIVRAASLLSPIKEAP